MNTKKFTVGTLVGGIAFFFLGYLVYGLLLAGFFKEHSLATSAMRPMAEIVWWALILGNISSGALLTWVFLKLGNVTTLATGARVGGTIGFFLAISLDLIRYATEGGFDLTATLADIVVSTLVSAIGGAIIAAVIGAGKKA